MDESLKEQYVYRVFQKISKGYDRANRRISFGLQGSWKKMLIRQLEKRTPFRGNVLDVCCGTGDISQGIAKVRPDLNVTGLDFSPAMLRIAKAGNKRKNVHFRRGNALELPFEDDRFDGVCISFGLRNTSDYKRVLHEMRRVTKPGGYIYCLDSFVPENVLIRPFYTLYFRFVMPLLGGGIKHLEEYRWLYRSTKHFLRPEELRILLVRSGIRKIRSKTRMFGACNLIWGQK